MHAKVAANMKASAELASDRSVPMNYYCPLAAIQKALPRDAIVMQEGANTMDIGRGVLMNYFPRSRLDAGTFGTMGVGLPQVIAAAIVHPDRKVVAVMGDSAFGFTGMEYETIVRYRLNALIIILNNNGIVYGDLEWPEEYGASTEGALKIPPSSLKPDNHYEQMAASVFGGRAWQVWTPDELDDALPEAMAMVGPGILHVRISPQGTRKKQEFSFDPTGGIANAQFKKKSAAEVSKL